MEKVTLGKTKHWPWSEPKLASDVACYMELCCICQRSRGVLTNPSLYTPLPMPNRPWLAVTMDFCFWVTLHSEERGFYPCGGELIFQDGPFL
jgi:hypothetical protein